MPPPGLFDDPGKEFELSDLNFELSYRLLKKKNEVPDRKKPVIGVPYLESMNFKQNDRRASALQDLAVKPITQFPVTLDDEPPEQKYAKFRGLKTVTIKKQGNQNLGIMIIEGKHAEVGQGIFISDIQQGSSAEQAGLTIGDMILAVNKDTLLGTNYDTAASLLKKTEGLVTLVVCNPNKAREEVKSVMGTLDTKGSTPNRSPTPTSKESSEKTSKSYYKIVFDAITTREIGKQSNG
ncbi:hypothetical protein RUM43_004169 [Polyplax serrata]|uniref:PDZ domain-containing protein n=1 Tax=Polyplax serrata TaxID=468196 RepID=A0AAN8SB18_POLSC